MLSPGSALDDRILYRIAFVATLLTLILIPLQIVVFAVVPMPTDVEAWFDLFRDAPLAALFHADLFLLVNNLLIAVIYVALFWSLKDQFPGTGLLALVLGLLGMAAYVASNRAFELLEIARLNRLTGANPAELVLLAQSALLSWKGTGFLVYYVLNGLALLLFSALIFRSTNFDRATGVWALAAAILMMVPSTAGPVGLVFSLLSLIPWYVFSVRCLGFWRKWSRKVSPA